MKISLLELEQRIDMQAFSELFTPNVRRVIEVLRKYHFDVRVVGGAVRDFMRGGIKPRDIDFATNAEPAEIMFIFDLEGIEHDDGGVQHGTIKAVFGDEVVDVTSITYRLRVRNGRVEIDRDASWEEDSHRRDLTINSMSIDIDGNLYDYQGGLSDLEKQMVRFSPGAAERIQEDPFTILRWFKALDMFDNPRWMRRDRQLISRYAQMVTKVVDHSRTKKLMQALRHSKNWSRTQRMMCDTGVAPHVGISC